MSEATDKWMKARTRLKNAQTELQTAENALRQIAGQLHNWTMIAPGSANSINIPSFTTLPTVEKLRALAAEMNSALLDEFNAFNQISRDEQSLLNRG